MAQDLDAFLNDEVYPTLYERLDVAFPEFGWTRTGDAWKATHWPGDFPDPANDRRPDRLMVYRDRPWWVKVHGHEGVRFLALANGGRNPVGPEFLAAVETLCERAGVPFPEIGRSAEQVEEARKREARRSALDVVLALTQEALWADTGTAARAYLHERGFTDPHLRDLGFGLYVSADAVREVIRRDHRELDDATQAAALVWPKLDGYVVIPWADAQGHPLTLYGRWPAKTLPEGRPKTLALPGEGTKASPLYFDRARRAGHRELVAVEGVFDAALLQARGDTRVVAYVAAQFSGGQLDTLERFKVRSVVVQPDPDRGGDRGARSCVEGLAQHGIRAFVAPRLPDGLDPDEFLNRDGLDGWKAHVAHAVPGAVYVGRMLRDGIGPDAPYMARREAVERVLDYVPTLPPLDRDDVIRETADQTGYSHADLAAMAADRTRDRQGEDAKRALAVLLREAEAAKEKGVASAVHTLRAGLARLETRFVEPPPPFSVDRLLQESRRLPAGLPSGWRTLDQTEEAGGLELRFHAGELAYLAARTGHGKTTALVALLLNWLLHAPDDTSFVLFSLDEPEVSIGHRLLALLTAHASTDADDRWSAKRIREYLSDPGTRSFWSNFKALTVAQDTLRLCEDRLVVVHRPRWFVTDVVGYVRNLAAHRRVGGVLVDYVQRLQPHEKGYDMPRDLRVAAVGRELKALAVDVGAPVVAGAQIGREAVKGRQRIEPGNRYGDPATQNALRARRPDLHELREGGSEQEADLVLGIMNYRADYAEDASDESSVPGVTRFEVGLLKNRYGARGRWASLAFEGQYHYLRDPLPDELL